ncbi:MAG: hypothetical protein JW759_09265 [Candidatus Coatesbacteria bacterium]|nr:hypothetical protein [Candidatus Coatesbacteria bacterium]
MTEKIIALPIFVACYALLITRKVKIAYVSLGSALLLILLGVVSPETAMCESISWDVLGIYWGFMMVSMIFSESNMPALIVAKVVDHARREKYVIVYLAAITAFLSAFMENVGAVLMAAPIAVELSKKLKTSLLPYMITVAVSANAVTTMTMIADPPALILAIATRMRFFDFYWFQGRLSLGVITLFGVVAALCSLLIIFRRFNGHVKLLEEKVKVKALPLLIFVGAVMSLAFGPRFGLRPGLVGLFAGLLSLAVARKKAFHMLKEFDWNSLLFITGIFVVISSLEITGLLTDFVNGIGGLGIANASVMLAIIIWTSVAASSFMDNVPFTILMIPVCEQLAQIMAVSPFPFLFGMLIGTGVGGNLTPVGATANVFACGILEKHGYKIGFREYAKVSLPFSIIAVLAAHVALEILWM